MCFVADVLEPDTEHGENKPRLRVIFENGTQSSMYRESLANRLYETGGQALTRTTVTADESAMPTWSPAISVMRGALPQRAP